jgi:4,5:9,10-diseco-3-hydroxy-5,9,17-trioxoandrosta-1(10),2-diene-4-oate hydrolase
VVWGSNIAPLAAAGFTVYALDQAGFGATDCPEDLSIDKRVDHVLSFIDHIGADRLAVWGCSDGSYVAARIGLQLPSVDALILMASAVLAPPEHSGHADHSLEIYEELRRYTPTREAARSLLCKMIVSPGRVTDELIDEALATSTPKNLAAHQIRMAAPRPPVILEDLHWLRVPTLLLWGLDDQVVVERGLPVLKVIQDAEMHVLPHCGHWIQRDQPDRANALVAQFLGAMCRA